MNPVEVKAWNFAQPLNIKHASQDISNVKFCLLGADVNETQFLDRIPIVDPVVPIYVISKLLQKSRMMSLISLSRKLQKTCGRSLIEAGDPRVEKS
mmetsp:Transcript_33467/g.50484  ORF Transcript_33467/g.50484 Transcript_33467/m.50484 type:complete len:96 (+) Transcript_33467:618-905(+)